MIKRSTAVLATVAVIVLPGGSLVVGAVWLYRYARQAASRRLQHKLATPVVALTFDRGAA